MVNGGIGRFFIVLVADQIESRGYSSSEKRRLDENTLNCMNTIAKDFPDSFVSGSKTLGDEFEIVLSDPDDVFNVITYIKQLIGTKLHIGIGVGNIESEILARPSDMYGGAFTLSREAINKAKNLDSHIYINLDDETVTRRVNVMNDLIQFTLSKLTPRQTEHYYSIRYLSVKTGILDKQIAERLSISPPMVSKIKARSGYDYIENAERLVCDLLKDYIKDIISIKTG